MKIIKVKYYNKGQDYWYDPLDFEIKEGDYLIVETNEGEELVEASSDIEEVDEKHIKQTLKEIKRLPTTREIKNYNNLMKNADEMFKKTLDIVKKHKKDLKLVDIRYKFDGSKTTIYYTANGRVDFRELVKDLAQLFRSRIEMRQISQNDEIKMSGDYGKCGRMLCCKAFLKSPESTSMKFAKDQNLALNPSRITGYCGKLMCCLKFEQEVYKEKIQKLPKIGSKVSTKDGNGEVVELEVLKEAVRVKYRDGNDFYFKKYNADDIKDIKSKDKTKKEK